MPRREDARVTIAARHRRRTTGPSVAILLGVALLSSCTLARQVLLTRLLSAVLFYHFTFLATSLALVGTGAGGVAVYAWQ
jgi:hypothetical protein